ncbi:MAG: hypothetical protein V3W32_05030, partial [Gemmatimonadota bacterium]
MQTLLSSQFGAAPPTQAPPAQVSDVVQASPSSQDAALFAFTQPLAESHESSVQTFPSSQFGAAPPTQAPPAQVSDVVQASPSSQEAVLSAFTHPVAELHESSVQTLPSSQFGAAPPTQAPAEQVSAVVQASPSSHEAVLLAVTQPVAGSHESVVQTLPSSQFGAAPPTQAPAEQV